MRTFRYIQTFYGVFSRVFLLYFNISLIIKKLLNIFLYYKFKCKRLYNIFMP